MLLNVKNENQDLKTVEQVFVRKLKKIRKRRLGQIAALVAAAAVSAVCLAGCSGLKQGTGGTGSQGQNAGNDAESLSVQGENPSAWQQERLCVTTTLFPYYDFVRQIAGDRVKLKLVVPAGMDSHSFEPTPADMIDIQNSDIFLYNGGEMEQWVEDALESIGNPKLRAVSMMDSVDVLEEEIVEGMEEGDGHAHSHGHADDDDHAHADDEAHAHADDEAHVHADDEAHVHADDDDHVHDEHSYDEQAAGRDHHSYEPGQVREIEYDEHIWTSPVNAMKIVETISNILIQEDPQHQSFYQENTSRYLAELAALDEEFQQVSAERKRDMIIVGDKFPFRYLAESYGLQYRAAFAGCSSDTEPSARTIAYLIDQVRERQLPVVYYLELSSHRVAEIISEETGAVPMLLHSCHNVTRQEFDEGITYLQLMEQNVKNLRAGLAE